MTTFFSLRIYAIRTAISEIKNKLNKRILNVILKLHYLEGKKLNKLDGDTVRGAAGRERGGWDGREHGCADG